MGHSFLGEGLLTHVHVPRAGERAAEGAAAARGELHLRDAAEEVQQHQGVAPADGLGVRGVRAGRAGRRRPGHVGHGARGAPPGAAV